MRVPHLPPTPFPTPTLPTPTHVGVLWQQRSDLRAVNHGGQLSLDRARGQKQQVWAGAHAAWVGQRPGVVNTGTYCVVRRAAEGQSVAGRICNGPNLEVTAVLVALYVSRSQRPAAGLQVNRDGAPDSTVEAVLERAVYDAGLIAESNFGDLFKVWSRMVDLVPSWSDGGVGTRRSCAVAV